MGTDTCRPCAKYLLLALNLVFWLTGTTLIVLGVLFLLRPEVQNVIHLFNFTVLPLSSIEISAIFIIVAGIIIFLVGLFGLCGAQQESRTCLILYIVLVACALLMELALFAHMALHHDRWEVFIKQRLVSETKKYNHLNPSQYERSIDYVQSKYQCCGIDSAYDYGDSIVPKSCCSTANALSTVATCTVHHASLNGTLGCFRILANEAIYWIKFFIIAELGLCLMSLIGIYLAICVCQNAMFYDGYIQTPYRV
ncbi:unnamed protein product [Rotaria magnacalcarata]|uniref:Tetraspanin n=2 Tax=Rotaria magnacalcarata TaxID=392030 RepID=A0A816N0U1_9BILA|nr:unnamed protein product [Rotaria magnacalcarata]CAF1489386.1 unnamed protein product [Rotaria magnacalcarata]CAF2011191.1 unnamed protein product [Rotaria magnacalcarata]CAF3831959.1 unnamed protein product [Rotaria magnacalcarata]CAF3869507.1 unnamed protein product [Rotaria magnacalcarata]